MIVVAHAGHWAVQILYAAPLLVMICMLAIGKWRETRKANRRAARRHPSRDR